MHEAFSYNREYDYIRLEGLHRATGRPAHEWDIYIIKELIDNALDADEALWCCDTRLFPLLSISVEYIAVPPPQCQQLIVRVGNRGQFPVEQILDIFATQWYTSRKSFLKSITRGALGNALKTLLGIPYALHNRVAEDWKPALKPLSICCGATEYLPCYMVDPTIQILRLGCERRPCKPVAGTLISVGLDYFVQEKPRTLTEIESLAQQYALCNPHAQFHWVVEMQDRMWEKTYPVQTGWTQKYRELAPVQWYSLASFKDLLSALYRDHNKGTAGGNRLPVQTVCSYFAGFSVPVSPTQQGYMPVARVIQKLGQDTLTSDDINSPIAKVLYAAIARHNPSFRSTQLGYIGQEHVQTQLRSSLPIAGKIQYAIATDVDNDPSMPLVVEMAVAYLQEGKRQVWTAINFSPTYNDPFLSRWFHPPLQPDQLVLGLRGLLDTYDMREDTSMLLFIHLVCPNIEHNEFSKTEINHLPFKKVLSELLDKLLKELQQGREEESMRLEQSIFQALNAILSKLTGNERFISEQLLETLRVHLSHDAALTAWLERPETLNRLLAYIDSYQDSNPEINMFIARPSEAWLHIPSHPAHYFSVSVRQLSHDLLEKHVVNKILYVHPQELEPVVIENNWLCRMDMALLQTPFDTTVLQEALLHCCGLGELSILVLHNGDDEGYDLVEQMRTWLKQHSLDARRIIDLHSPRRQGVSLQPMKVMPSELENWLLARLTALGISIKYIPSQVQLINDIHNYFEHLLREHILGDIERRFALTSLFLEIDTTLSYTEMMRITKVDEWIRYYLQQEMKVETYHMALNRTVERFFEDFIKRYSSHIQQLERARFGWK
jgi:hypothetical protein